MEGEKQTKKEAATRAASWQLRSSWDEGDAQR
jgi:hypothetical protein